MHQSEELQGSSGVADALPDLVAEDRGVYVELPFG